MTVPATVRAGTRVLADTHVHLYDAYDLGAFTARALSLARHAGTPVVLCLTESARYDYFGALREAAAGRFGAGRGGRSPSRVDPKRVGTTLHRPQDPLALGLGDEEGPVVFRIAGRQLVSREGIEVLAIGVDAAHPVAATEDGSMSLVDLVRAALGAAAAAVVPWSFGKWTGARARAVQSLAETPVSREPLFFFGDISARCWPWPRPAVFDGPARLLPGTDRLPFPGRERRIGTYGIELTGSLDPDAPAASFLELLRSGAPGSIHGRPDGPVGTLIDQIRIRFGRPT